ncbi:MAG: AzlC family ABC transporter permease [Spirochaetales bacterium]|nr:AzlC family ABC transporter permease [Spirochaetales bacterium]
MKDGSVSGAGAGGASAFAAALRATFPVLLGYTTLGLAFGLVLVDSGLPWWLSPLMAAFVYAGAAQFMGVGLLASGAGVGEIALMTALLNARHLVYGLSMLERFAGSGPLKSYLVFGLTDETYGILSTEEPPAGVEPLRFRALVTALDQAYWFAGCTAGALAGSALPLEAEGLDFALTALFVVLLVEQVLAKRPKSVFLTGAVASGLALVFVAPRNFLLAAMGIGMAILLGARVSSSRRGGGGDS